MSLYPYFQDLNWSVLPAIAWVIGVIAGLKKSSKKSHQTTSG